MSNILPFVKYSSDPFFEFCRPHTSDASKDVTWVVRRRLTVLRCVGREDQLINTHMEPMCSFVGCVPKCLDEKESESGQCGVCVIVYMSLRMHADECFECVSACVVCSSYCSHPLVGE